MDEMYWVLCASNAIDDWQPDVVTMTDILPSIATGEREQLPCIVLPQVERWEV